MARAPRRGHDVFISYAFDDRAAADAICEALETAGIRCWIAPRDGTPGASYAAFLVDAITRSRVVVAVFSRSANRSDAVLSEMEIAANRKRTIVPVRIDAVEPSGASEFYLRTRHWIDAPQAPGASLQPVVDAVRAALRPARPPRDAVPAPAVTPAAAPPPRGNLPVPATSFVGRERECGEVIGLLETSRVVTLWGPGGVGKTRLALEAARAVEQTYPDGAWFVDLAGVSDEGGVVPALMATLSVREERDVAGIESLVAALRERCALLVIDNCEHVLGAAAVAAARIIAAAPRARIACTSREPLGVAGEHVYAVGPLGAAAVDLFIARAAAAGVTYDDPESRATIGSICSHLDEIPFAIELAAARARSMPPAEIAASLDMRFRLLTGGSRTAAIRHQTLRNALDWSYALLDEVQRRAFVRAAVFAGGWTADAFAAVAGDGAPKWEILDALGALVDKSLVTNDPATGRYRQLETTREYAYDLLRESGAEQMLRSRHAVQLLRAVEEGVRAWRAAPNEGPLRALLAERDNARAALEWALFERHDVLVGARLAAALGVVWEFSGAYETGFAALAAAAAELPENAPDADVAAVQLALAGLALKREERAEGLAHARRAAELAARSGAVAHEARALWLVGACLHHSLDLEGAEAALTRALALYREAADSRGITACLAQLAFSAGQRGDRTRARATYREIAEVSTARGDVRVESHALLNLAEFAFADGDVDEAISIATHVVDRMREAGLPGDAPLTSNLATYLLAAGRDEEARSRVVDLLDLVQAELTPHWVAVAARVLALLELRAGRPDAARTFVALAGGTAEADDRALDPSEAYVNRELLSALGPISARPGVAPAEMFARARATLQRGWPVRNTTEPTNVQ